MIVGTDTHEGIRLITMDDGKANAVSHAMLDELEPALQAAETDAAVKAVVLAGRPGMFSGGIDLAVLRSGDLDRAKALGQRAGGLVPVIYGFAKPFVAAATGHAIGMGAVLLLAADHRVGANGGFRIGLNETAIGVDLPYFASELALARLNSAQLTAAALGARIYDPADAVEAGFLDEVCAAKAAVATAVARARGLAAHPQAVYARNKRRLREGTLAVIGKSLKEGPLL